MVSTHDTFLAPLGCFAGWLRYISRACLAGASVGNLSRCPSHLIRRILIVLDHGVCLVRLYSSLLLIFCGHLILRIFLSIFRWQMSIVSFLSLVMDHSSLLCRKMLPRRAWKSLILILISICLFVRILITLLKAAVASWFLLEISFSVRRIEPTYLHLSHSSYSLLMMYSSVFVRFMLSSLRDSLPGILSLMMSMACLQFPPTQQMSSAYCRFISFPESV